MFFAVRLLQVLRMVATRASYETTICFDDLKGFQCCAKDWDTSREEMESRCNLRVIVAQKQQSQLYLEAEEVLKAVVC